MLYSLLSDVLLQVHIWGYCNACSYTAIHEWLCSDELHVDALLVVLRGYNF